jgi:hypothetical protein
MTKHKAIDDKGTVKGQKPSTKDEKNHPIDKVEKGTPNLSALQQKIGNRAIQRLLTQRSEDGSTELNEDTASRVNQERSGGQPLMEGVQKQMGAALGYDLSGVHVHTSPEADSLNRELGAKAFTTGQDIFFREGNYDPNTSSGQQLIAHELTHVVQQGTGEVSSDAGRMKVNEPGDIFEQEADSVADTITNTDVSAQIQKQEEEEIQMQVEPEEEEEEAIQMQVEEEEEIQMQEEEEEEEEELIQTQEEEEEELMP